MGIYAYLGFAIAAGMAVNSLRIPGHLRIFLVAAVVFAIGWSGGAGDPQAIPKFFAAKAETGAPPKANSNDCATLTAESVQSAAGGESQNPCIQTAEPLNYLSSD